jgi:hypothetical protein
MESTDPIFEPLRFRSLTVKNRLTRSSITGRIDNYDGSGTQARINWETKFARGGAGMIMSAHIPIHVGGRIIPNVATLKATPRSRSGGGSERRFTATDARMSRSCRTPAASRTSVAWRTRASCRSVRVTGATGFTACPYERSVRVLFDAFTVGKRSPRYRRALRRR